MNLHSPQCKLHSLVCSDGEPRDLSSDSGGSGCPGEAQAALPGVHPRTCGCAGELAATASQVPVVVARTGAAGTGRGLGANLASFRPGVVASRRFPGP